MSEREKSEGRFHILQPNRDLESNWAVDVAKQLEEYLLEICSSGGLGDDGCPVVNFAEAALLLQGSIQVYSRKVEYLYTLVVHALEFISQKRQDAQEKSSIQPDGTDVDAVVDDDNEEFLSLDDVPVEANIDLDDDLGSDNPSFNRPVKPPASLLVLEGECLDATSDMGELSSYQIATSSLHRDFLLLDPCDSEAIDNFLKANVCSNLQMSTQKGSSARSKSRRSFLQSPIRHGSAQKSGLGKGRDLEMNGVARDSCNFEEDNDIGPAPNFCHDFPDDTAHAGEDMGGGFSELEDLDDDPWVPLNPHEPGTLKVKPFKKASLVCRLRSCSKQKIALAKFSCARLHGTANPEFADAMDAVERLRATQSPAPFQKLRESLVSGIQASDAFPEPNNDIEDNDCVNEQYDFEETDTGLFHDSYMDNEAAAFSGADDIGGMCNNHSTENEDLNATTSLEDLCRSHLDALLARIAEAEKQTELAAHVSTWKQRIEHSLEEQELHPPFDIHEYGEKFMAKLSSEKDFGGSRSFAELVGGQPKYEIARTFSALLQLVNNGNVALDKGKSSNGPLCFTAANPFYVSLLSNNRKHEEMLNYRAPSVVRKLDTKKKRISSPAKNFDDENHLLDGTATTLSASPTKLSPSSGKLSCKAGKGWSIKCTPESKRRRRSQFLKNIAFAR
ncbi:condensin-2 complex subunit H2 [Nymphaea colorata]|nr:condensin-2 complex subunit H2 [Nymphaea colorata]